MKILFLDIDGVLNSMRNVRAYNRFPMPNVESEAELDPIAIGMIRKICDLTKSSIVLSSTWRDYVDPIEFGKKYNLPIVDKTISGSKARSIRLYREERPEIVKYAIIDDDDMQDVNNNQVFTDLDNGMLCEHFFKLMELLIDDPKDLMHSDIIVT
jgi:hypothetical protein